MGDHLHFVSIYCPFAVIASSFLLSSSDTCSPALLLPRRKTLIEQHPLLSLWKPRLMSHETLPTMLDHHLELVIASTAGLIAHWGFFIHGEKDLLAANIARTHILGSDLSDLPLR